MAEIITSTVSRGVTISVAAGERISIRILNADGSPKTEVLDDNVPSGKQFDGMVDYNGLLSTV